MIIRAEAIANGPLKNDPKRDDKWRPARPEDGGWSFARVRAAWLVLVGRADAVVWNEEGGR